MAEYQHFDGETYITFNIVSYADNRRRSGAGCEENL